jgi:hypothetical protein
MKINKNIIVVAIIGLSIPLYFAVHGILADGSLSPFTENKINNNIGDSSSINLAKQKTISGLSHDDFLKCYANAVVFRTQTLSIALVGGLRGDTDASVYAKVWDEKVLKKIMNEFSNELSNRALENNNEFLKKTKELGTKINENGPKNALIVSAKYLEKFCGVPNPMMPEMQSALEKDVANR